MRLLRPDREILCSLLDPLMEIRRPREFEVTIFWQTPGLEKYAYAPFNVEYERSYDCIFPSILRQQNCR